MLQSLIPIGGKDNYNISAVVSQEGLTDRNSWPRGGKLSAIPWFLAPGRPDTCRSHTGCCFVDWAEGER